MRGAHSLCARRPPSLSPSERTGGSVVRFRAHHFQALVAAGLADNAASKLQAARFADKTNLKQGCRLSALASTNTSQRLQNITIEKWLHVMKKNKKSSFPTGSLSSCPLGYPCFLLSSQQVRYSQGSRSRKPSTFHVKTFHSKTAYRDNRPIAAFPEEVPSRRLNRSLGWRE